MALSLTTLAAQLTAASAHPPVRRAVYVEAPDGRLLRVLGIREHRGEDGERAVVLEVGTEAP